MAPRWLQGRPGSGPARRPAPAIGNKPTRPLSSTTSTAPSAPPPASSAARKHTAPKGKRSGTPTKPREIPALHLAEQINEKAMNAGSTLISPLHKQVQILTTAQALCTQSGTRLNRSQFADRLGIHRNTLGSSLDQDGSMPRPDKSGKWRLADIIAWESPPVRRRAVRQCSIRSGCNRSWLSWGQSSQTLCTDPAHAAPAPCGSLRCAGYRER